MGDRIEDVAERLNQQISDSQADFAVRLATGNNDDGLNAKHSLSNTSLLLESLATFYRDEKSEFFPTGITAKIRELLIQAEGTFMGLPAGEVPADAASNLLRQLEGLYAYCLQYGLMTYGFTGKSAQEQIELIRRARQQTETAAQRVLAAAKRHESELARKLDAFGGSLVQAEADFKTALTERLSALQPSIDGLAVLLVEGKSHSTELGDFFKTAKENAAAVQGVRAELDSAALAATAEFSSRKTTADAELATIQSVGKQVKEFESDAKAKLQDVTDARATIKVQMTGITEFYGEIESHREQMTNAGKAAQSQLTELRESSEKSVAALRERTDKVVHTNESLIGRINDHLRKAIGVSMFTSFDTRRRHITTASLVWGVLLLLSVGGTIWFALWFVAHLAELAKSDIHPALVYARLVIVAPLAFLVAFTAKRYSSERRAEEEYAFKSAISVSLDSYRDLIARMKKEGDDTTFVERLVLEIFDNPAKRLYAVPPTTVEKDGLDGLNLVKELVDRIPKAE